MSVESFNRYTHTIRLVKLAARAFYYDFTTKGENQPKTGKSDNRGIAVVVLDALTRRQRVREEDLAKDLKLHSKQLCRTLRFLEEEKLVTRDHRKEVEVAFSGVEERGEDIKSENANSHMKVLPPWMIKQGMNLTKEQSGVVKEEVKVDGTSAPIDLSDDKKSMIGKDDTKNLQDEYIKADYAALLQRQREQDEAANSQQGSLDRQIGMKSKRDENEGDEDIEWEEDAPAGNTNESYKVNDLNVEADALGYDEDDIDWEEG